MVSLIQNYIDKGWGIIPIRPKGHINEKTGEVDEKIPYVKWADYRSSDGKKPDEDQILHWLSQFDHADWAVLTGYDNLVLVDIDDPNLYDLYLSNFTKCLMRTPSGGISFLIYSTVVPKAQTRINGVAVDIKAINGYAILPSRDLSDEEIALEEKEEKAGTRRDFIRHWIDDSEPEEIDDIYRHLESVLPLIKPDVKPGKGIPTAIQWARDHNLSIAFDGGRYLQVICPNPGHNDTKPSMSIYADGFWCHSCLYPDQEVITSDGLISAKDIVVGDEITDGLGNAEQVTAVHCHQDDKGLALITTLSCGAPLVVTRDHPVYIIKNTNCEMRTQKLACTPDCAAINNGRHKCASKHWKFLTHEITKVRAEEITENDSLVFPLSKSIFGKKQEFLDVSHLIKHNKKGVKNPRVLELPLSEDFMWVYGLFLAEGDYYRGGIRFSLHREETDYAERVQDTFKKIGLKVSIFRRGENGLQAICSKTDLVHIFKDLFGVHCDNKHIPKEFLNLSKNQQIALLNGIYCGDGIKSDIPRKTITLTSKTLSLQMFNIALNLKLYPRFSYLPTKEDRKQAYTVFWARDENKTSTHGRTYETINGIEYYIVPVKNVSFTDYKGEVYDITVSGEHHSFTTPQGLVGNCHFGGGLFALIKAYTSKTDDEIYADFPGIKKQKKTITDNVIEIVGDNVTLVRDHNNNGYFKLADYSAVGINLLPINSKITRYWMATAAEKVIDKLPSSSVLNYVIEYFNGKCMSQGDKAKIYRRVGGDQKVIWYDLGNNNFVKITEDGISVYPYADVTFIRETNQGVQNVPSKKDIKSIFKLFRIINVKDEAQKILLLTWIVNSLIPWAQSPILLLCGARGSGKSFMGRIIKRTLDPVEGNASELLVNKPKDLNYLIGLLSHNAVAVLDNISRIDRETGDVLCNVVTGGVIPTRELYTTNDQVLIDIRSKLIITAINSQIFDTGAGDLAERTVSIEISRPDANYLSEEWLNEEFETYRSEIFGAILALIQGYLKEGIPTKGAVSEFRLTTFASVGRYISSVLKMNPSFDVAYRLSQTGMCQTSLEAEPVTDFFVWFVRKHGDEDFNNTAGWGISADILFGTYFTNWMTENNKVGMTDKKFPTTSSSLLNRLKRIEPDLKRIYAITVEPKGVHKGKKWFKLSCSNKEILNDGVEEELLDEQTSIEKEGW
jgi:intein/homing endonuclease